MIYLSTRVNKIFNNEFFSDKKDLAEQVIEFEKEGKVYLPNSFTTKIIPGYKIGETIVSIGRFHTFYYFAMQNNEGHWNHQLLESKSAFKQFFLTTYEMQIQQLKENDEDSAESKLDSEKEIEKQLAFWFTEIERLN